MSFPHCKSMEANNRQDMANLDPRGMVGIIYELNIKLGAPWFLRNVDVFILPIIILWKLMTPRAWPICTPLT